MKKVVRKKPGRKKKLINNEVLKTFLFYFLTIYFLEIAFRFLALESIMNVTLFYLVIFTIPIAIFFTFISRIFKEKTNKIITWIITSILVFLFAFQYVFITVYSVPFSFSTIEMATQVVGFVDIIVDLILSRILGILLLTVPLIVLFFIRKKLNFNKTLHIQNYIMLGAFLITVLLSLVSLLPGKNKLYSSFHLYFKTDAGVQVVDRFGLITGMQIDISRVFFGYEEQIIDTGKPAVIIPEVAYNITDIDFEQLAKNEKNSDLKKMHLYFMNKNATKQNDYTGMFKDKNLIFIIAEGFNQIAVHEEVTPTLYKLSNEGFVFNNFYSPVFLSTTGGEFQATTSLIPTQDILETWKDKQPYIAYALGNTFAKEEYQVRAYHDWNYRFYKRNKTMPTLGFKNFKACGNGLEKLMNCKNWTPSDIDMVKVTADDFLDKEEKFLTYYFTVSGHSNYNWMGQRMASKNKKHVNHLPYSDAAKSYLATQLEFDNALKLLIEKLEATDELKDTVIAIVGDHYPYSLSDKQINELSTYDRDRIFEVNRSNFIIWNSEMPRIEIDKVGGQMDVLPTLLNLFDIEYDSRLLMGKDILSDAPGLVVFSNRSWITDEGRYNTGTHKFKGKEVSKQYIDDINAEITNIYAMSKLIVEKNYYKKILK